MPAKLVCVIDDSPTIRKLIEVCLTREGFIVQGFSNGVEALRRLSQPGAAIPDLVLLDINMPHMNGYQVALAFRRSVQLAHVPVIFISRYHGVMDRLKCCLAGGRGYIAKPFHTAHLLACAHQMLRASSVLREGGAE